MDDFQAQLAALRKTYSSTLTKRLAELDVALTSAAEHRDDTHLQAALRLSHRLHGTTGTYGFTVVSANLGQLEILMRDLVDGQQPADDAAFAKARALNTKAKEALSQLDLSADESTTD